MPDDFPYPPPPPQDVAITVGEAVLRVIAAMPQPTRKRVLAALLLAETPPAWGVWCVVPEDKPWRRSGWIGGAHPQTFSDNAAAHALADRLLTPAAKDAGYSYEVRRFSPAKEDA